MKVDHHNCECHFVEARWVSYRAEPPRVGEVFVGRKNAEVFPRLFVKQEDGGITYFNDSSTQIGAPYDIFTHWLLVGMTR
jgi:hypothetical protein